MGDRERQRLAAGDGSSGAWLEKLAVRERLRPRVQATCDRQIGRDPRRAGQLAWAID
jgi:hypothetical protein